MAFNTKTFDGQIQSSGGGGVSGLTEDQILFGAADGTIDQSSQLSWNDTVLTVGFGTNNMMFSPNVETKSITGTNNIGIGPSALSLLDSGSFNIAIGRNVLNDITSNTGNVAIGDQAMSSTGTQLFQNAIAIGYRAGIDNGGSANIFIGENTGQTSSTTGGITGSSHVVIGKDAGRDLTTAEESILIGRSSGDGITTGGKNIAIGSFALGRTAAIITGTNNIAIGENSMGYAPNGLSGNHNIAMGSRAGYQITSGVGNVFLGYEAGRSLTSSNHSILVGFESGSKTTGTISGADNIGIGRGVFSGNTTNLIGNNNIAMGFQSVQAATSADKTVALGFRAGWSISSGDYNTFIGGYAGQNIATNSHNIAIGQKSGYRFLSDNNIFLGQSAGRVSFGSSGTGNNIGIGTSALGRTTAAITGNNNIAIGEQAMGYAPNGLSGTHNIAMGFQAGYQVTGGIGNVFLGYQAGEVALAGGYHVAIGFQAGNNLSGSSDNIAIGREALSSTTSAGNLAINNIAIGDNALAMGAAQLTGDFNVAIGGNIGAAGGLTAFSGRGNIFIGQAAGNSFREGDYNIIMGFSNAGNYSGFSNVIAFGRNSADSNTTSQRLFIDTTDNGTDALVYGEFDNDILRVGGEFQFRDGIVAESISTSAAGNYTVLVTDHTVLKTAITGGGDTVTLPSTAATGQIFYIVDASGSAGTDNITIATAGSENIDGAATATISTNYGGVTVQFDGTNYWIISNK